DAPRICFFFFQAEDGIRDFHVTGVQTCALPIFIELSQEELTARLEQEKTALNKLKFAHAVSAIENPNAIKAGRKTIARISTEIRSEERRVGKECRSRGRGWGYTSTGERVGATCG